MNRYDKRYLLVVIITVVMISGCNSKMIALKGSYATVPVVITSTKPVDSIWSGITDLFTANGLTIKKIEKEKGIITSAETEFIPVYTFEDKEGKLLTPQAWVVISAVMDHEKQWYPHKIHGKWNIQVNDTHNGISTIKIDPVITCIYFPNIFTSMEARGLSTGKLEEIIKISLGK